MSEKPYVSVVVPVLNEDENIEPLYEKLRDILGREAARHEMLFVDDGSTDGTAARVEALHRKDPLVKLVSLSRNFGHQLALTAGLDHASGDVVITMDADLQHPPETIPELLAKHREGYEVVSAVKTGDARRSWFLETTAGFYYWILSRISNVPIDRHASDFRLLDRKVVDALRAARESTRFLRGLVKWVGFKATTIPYQCAERLHGKPTYTLRKRMEVGTAGLVSFSTLPLRLSILAGLCAIALALPGTAISLLFWGQGWSFTTVVVLFMGGLQLVFIGILGEYVGRVFIEVKHRPLYLVRNRVGVDRTPE